MAKKWVRCKTCGYIMAEGAYHVCPACGVPEKMFEPWEDKIPENRRRIIDLHIHPVIVHAPQALAFLMLGLAAVYLVLSQAFAGSELGSYILSTLRVMGVLLPIMVVAGFLSGILDAKYRYKTTSTILLNRKKIAGTAFFLVSLGMMALVLQAGFVSELLLQLGFLVLNLLAFACTAILGIWGSSLVGGIMPGPFIKKKKTQNEAAKNAD